MRKPLRVYVAGLAGGSRELSADAAHYLTRVHRLGVGDAFTAFDPEQAKECDAVVTRVSGALVEGEFQEPHSAVCLGQLPVTLLQVPGKSERLEEVVRAATALGVRAVHVLQSERSAFIPSDKHRARLKTIAIEAARQSGRGDLPMIVGPTQLPLALESVGASIRICLHPRAPVALATRVASRAPSAEVSLCVGPEGGFSDAELVRLQDAGFELAAMGPLTMRAELASVAALGYFAASLPGASSLTDPE